MAYEAFGNSDMGPPDFTNDDGVEFRCELGLTKYAREKLGKEWTVWFVSGSVEPNYLLTNSNIPEKESQRYEDIAVYIDVLRLAIDTRA